MLFFRSTANVPDGEKARIEFHLQQIAECVGLDRVMLPMLDAASVIYQDQSNQSETRSSRELMDLAGKHLGHDVSGLSIQTTLLQPEKCGGGG